MYVCSQTVVTDCLPGLVATLQGNLRLNAQNPDQDPDPDPDPAWVRLPILGAASAPRRAARVRAEALDWAAPAVPGAGFDSGCQGVRSFDLVIGTDVCYEPQHAPLIARVLTERLAPGGVAWLVLAVRQQVCAPHAALARPGPRRLAPRVDACFGRTSSSRCCVSSLSRRCASSAAAWRWSRRAARGAQPRGARRGVLRAPSPVPLWKRGQRNEEELSEGPMRSPDFGMEVRPLPPWYPPQPAPADAGFACSCCC